MCHLQMYSSYIQTCEDDPIPFNSFSATLDLKWSKEINTNVGERWMIWSDSVRREICHVLLTSAPTQSSADNALSH